jgi:hypothetical protein
MAENDVTIQINVEAKDAQAAIELFGRESVKVLTKTEQQSDSFFSSFKVGATKIAGAVGIAVAAYRTLSGAIAQASEDAKLTRQIEASLRATDEASQAAVEGVIAFADALKEATGISDDLAKQTFITAKSFGVSAEEAKKLTKAAIDYAAATGTDVETAVRQLGGTLDGTIGKIGNLGAEFRNLTTEQLKSGAAIDLVTQKFGGTASRELDTYQGSLNQLKNATDDFLKVFGKVVIESDLVKNALSGVAGAINATTEALSSKQDTTANLERSLSIVAALGGNVQAASDSVLKAQERIALAGIEVGKTSQQISSGFSAIVDAQVGATKSSADFEDRLKSLIPNELPQKLELTGKALEDFNKKQKALAEEGAKFKQSVLSGFGDDADKEASKAQEALQKVIDLQAKGALSFKDSYDLKIKIAEDFNAKIISIEEARAKKEQDILEKAAKEAKDLRDKQDAEFSKTAGLATGFTANVLQGRQGAVSAVSGVAELAGQAAGIPGLGQVAQLLSAGPEQTKAMVKAFVEALPDIIQAIAESIPVVVETFVDVMVNKGGAVKIGIAIAKAMAGQAIWASIGKQIFGKSGDEIRESIRSATVEYIKGAQDSFTQFTTQFFPTLGLAFQNLGKQLKIAFDEFPGKFKEGAASFFSGFSKAASDFVASFVPALSQFFEQFIPTLIEALAAFVRTIASAILGPLQQIFEPLKTAFQGLTDAIQRLIGPIERLIDSFGGGGGGGGGGGFIGQIGGAISRGGKAVLKSIGFANGGLVPAYAADGMFVPRGTDTVPAMLTPGEMVVPRDMVGELGAFLSAQGPQSNGSDQTMLAAILAAVQAPMTVTAEAKVNQSAFADIILQLNRQNARLSA